MTRWEVNIEKGKMYKVLLVFTLLALLFVSCNSASESEWSKEANKILESRSTQDMMNDLYLASHGDEESLARMLKITPSSIERLRKGETLATPKFEEELEQVAYYYYLHGRSYSKLRSFLDEKYSLSDKILDFPSNHPQVFWPIVIVLGCMILLGLILMCCGLWGPGCGFIVAGIILPVIVVFIFLVAWLTSHKPATIEDKYIDVINPKVEQII